MSNRLSWPALRRHRARDVAAARCAWRRGAGLVSLTGRDQGRRRTPDAPVPSPHHPFPVRYRQSTTVRGGERSRRGHCPAGARTRGGRSGRVRPAAGREGPEARGGGDGFGGGPKFAATMASNSASSHAGSASTRSANPPAERTVIVFHSPDRLAISPGHVLRFTIFYSSHRSFFQAPARHSLRPPATALPRGGPSPPGPRRATGPGRTSRGTPPSRRPRPGRRAGGGTARAAPRPGRAPPGGRPSS